MAILDLPLWELSRKIEAKVVSPSEVVEESLERIDQAEPRLSAYVTVTADSARKEALRAENEIQNGNYRGRLHGIPYAAKDLYESRGIVTTASSGVLRDYTPKADAVTISRLKKAGMILVGKTETHEFAYGALTLQTGNPWNIDRVSGGSSGGSGAAVGAGTVHIALGTDTGGSIRVPAALCGSVGLKPTFGVIPRSGIIPLSWSLDHAGPLSRNVTDAALALEALAGQDPGDPSSRTSSSAARYIGIADRLRGDVKDLKIGVPENFFTESVAEHIQSAFEDTLQLLARLGAKLEPITIPLVNPPGCVADVHKALFISEMAAYHLPQMKSDPSLYSEEVRSANEMGNAVFAVDYINAQRVRQQFRSAWSELYKTVDVILSPTVPLEAINRNDPVVRWPDGTVENGSDAYLRLTRLANLTGSPALQIPNGFTRDHMPVGVQIMGRPFEEDVILNVGRALELETSYVGKIAETFL